MHSRNGLQRLNSRPARQLMTFSDQSGQLRFCNRCCIVSTITRRQQMAPCSVPFQIPFSGRAELWNPWQGDVGNRESVGGVEAFHRRCRASLWYLDGLQKPTIFYDGQKLNWRQARWSLLLAWFDFIMHHRPRKSMENMDALSCRSDHRTGSEDNDNMVLLTLNFFAVRATAAAT